MLKKLFSLRKKKDQHYMHSTTFGAVFVILLIILFVDFAEGFRTEVQNEMKRMETIEATGDTISAIEQVMEEPQKEETNTYFVNFNFLNVRAEPSIQSEIIQSLNQDDQVRAEATDNPEWMKVLFDDGSSGYVAKRYLAPLTKDVVNQKGLLYLPILMYHYISIPPVGADEIRENLSVSPAVLWTHLRYLSNNEVETVTFKDLKEVKDGAKTLPEKAVVLTFDDGHEDHYNNVFPLLKKLNQKAVFYIITDRVGTDGYMTWAHIKEMHDAGMEIGSHAKGDIDLRFITEAEGFDHIRDSKRIIDEMLGDPVVSFSYPSGHYAAWLFKVLSRSGYHFARTTEYGKYLDIEKHPFTLPTLRVKQSTSETDFINWGIK